MLKTGLLLLAGTLAVTGSLFAVPTLRLEQTVGASAGTGTTTIADASGLINVSNLIVGDFKISSAFGSTKDDSGTATNPELRINDFSSIVEAAGGTLQISLTETNFTLPLSTAFGVLTATLNSITGGTASIFNDVYLDELNRHFGGAGINGIDGISSFAPILSTGPQTALSTDVDIYNLSPLTPMGPYSLTLVMTLVQSGGSKVQATSIYSQVPEPGFYGALAVGLSGLLVFAKRRQQKSA